ncbi:PAS domain-containing protein [Roseomonas marmotae]|uniref:histidine kinase n=1 Tax=Roseomonas marmotae TaxID=2768161 RepID=A0ABS3K971_9PROT|nr:PAS domain-containing protein [Roseomonas marmotae]MBO1073475.1 PAS domain-containing protein [Roseomonas marmotae]QTI80332.1 PAS domain-containing protein [Roseomonas marmotae]
MPLAFTRYSSRHDAAAPVSDAASPGFLEAIGIAAYTTDAQGFLSGYNEAAAQLWGRRPALEEDRWCGSWQLLRPDGEPMPHDQCPMALALREGRAIHGLEAVMLRPDGMRIPFASYPAPLRDPAGRLIGAVNLLIDISDRKAAEATSANSEARLRALFETTPECITLVGPDGRLLQINPAGLQMIEADSGAAVHGVQIGLLIAPEHRAEWHAHHERVCRGEALQWEFDIIGLRGTRRRMEVHATPLQMPDGRFAQLAIARDFTGRKLAEERQRLLMREVDHRAKNVLAVALSLVRLTRAEDPRHFAKAVEGRVAALANAHSLLAAEGWSGAELRQVVQAELTHHLAAGRADLHGASLRLVPSTVQPLSLVLHELATNATRYGAFSTPEGRVTVSWQINLAAESFELRWLERGGPRLLAPPSRRGFGSNLIEATVQGQLGGEIGYFWEEEGLRCEVTLGLEHLLPQGTSASMEMEQGTGAATPETPPLAGRRVLVVEDEALIAAEIGAVLRSAGCCVLGPAATVEQAMRLAETSAIDLAVLDVNLGGQASFPVADLLARRGVPVVFATGYGDLPDWRPPAGPSMMLHKPLRQGELEAALSRMLALAVRSRELAAVG